MRKAVECAVLVDSSVSPRRLCGGGVCGICAQV